MRSRLESLASGMSRLGIRCDRFLCREREYKILFIDLTFSFTVRLPPPPPAPLERSSHHCQRYRTGALHATTRVSLQLPTQRDAV